MARLVGDTNDRGTRVRVCTEASRDRLYLKRFSGLRHPDGKEFYVSREEVSGLINLLLRAEQELES